MAAARHAARCLRVSVPPRRRDGHRPRPPASQRGPRHGQPLRRGRDRSRARKRPRQCSLPCSGSRPGARARCLHGSAASPISWPPVHASAPARSRRPSTSSAAPRMPPAPTRGHAKLLLGAADVEARRSGHSSARRGHLGASRRRRARFVRRGACGCADRDHAREAAIVDAYPSCCGSFCRRPAGAAPLVRDGQ